MKEQVRELATEVWQTSHWTNEQIKRLESFYSLVRNAALDEAMTELKCQADYSGSNRRTFYMDAIAHIHNIKEPTP